MRALNLFLEGARALAAGARRPLLATAAAAVTLFALAPAPAQAGQDCTGHKPTARTIERGMRLAAQTAQALDASGAQVVLLARAGQDLTRYGLRWSHLGWAWRLPDGRWRVAHKLNDCGSAEGHLWHQGLGEFFLDDLWRHEAVWAVPAPQVQQRLHALLQDDARTRALQHRPYSMVSYAWGTRYQQSNQWAVETLAAALQPQQIATRAQAQQWLRAQGYVPGTLTLGPLTRLGARLTRAHVAFDDHPPAQRHAGRIETVTVDSVLQWLQRSGLAGAPQMLRLQDADL